MHELRLALRFLRASPLVSRERSKPILIGATGAAWMWVWTTNACRNTASKAANTVALRPLAARNRRSLLRLPVIAMSMLYYNYP